MSLQLFVLFGLILLITIGSIGIDYENLKHDSKWDVIVIGLVCIFFNSLLVGPLIYTFILTQQNNFDKGCLNYGFSVIYLFVLSSLISIICFISTWFLKMINKKNRKFLQHSKEGNLDFTLFDRIELLQKWIFYLVCIFVFFSLLFYFSTLFLSDCDVKSEIILFFIIFFIALLSQTTLINSRNLSFYDDLNIFYYFVLISTSILTIFSGISLFFTIFQVNREVIYSFLLFLALYPFFLVLFIALYDKYDIIVVNYDLELGKASNLFVYAYKDKHPNSEKLWKENEKSEVLLNNQRNDKTFNLNLNQ